MYVYATKSIPNPNFSILEPNRPQHEHPASCYRPAVFFHHLHLTAFLFPQGIIGAVSKKEIL
jgi:hypothetical protein